MFSFRHKKDRSGRRLNGRGVLFRLTAVFLSAVFFLVLSSAVGAMVIYHHFAQDLPPVNSLKNYRPKTVSTFYSDDGRVIGEFFRERRFVTPLSRVPGHVVKAFLAAEDANFYHHPGMDFLGMARAMLRNYQAGRIVQGGSTITQQITRAFLLTPERSYSRKIREIILAWRLEKNLSKDEILYLYLNHIYFGAGAYGVEAAARVYFGKHVEELTLAEGALIAGLVKAPSAFNPFQDKDRAVRRQKNVLRLMKEAGFISPAEAARAAGQELLFGMKKEPVFEAPFFTEHVRRYIVETLGEDRLYEDGLKIYTTVDLELQAAAREAIRRGLAELAERHPREENMDDVQAALVCTDLPSGQVKAMVGGRDYSSSEFNRAVQSRRQPGSAFKPIIYAAAMSGGFSPADMIMDEPVEYNLGGKVWSPNNYDRRYEGPTTLFEGLVRSRNVVAVRLLETVGLPKVTRLAQNLGIESPLGSHLSLALGTSEVTLLEMTSALSVFARSGVRVDPTFVRRIEDRDGRILLEVKPRRIRVLAPDVSYVVLDMLRNVVEHGTGAAVKRLNRPVAGKTGTTSELADAWFVGFTPELAAGVWVGKDLREGLGDKETGGRAAAPVFLYFMEKALENQPPSEFIPPPGVVFAAVDQETGRIVEEGAEGSRMVCFRESQLADGALPEGEQTDESVEYIHLIFDRRGSKIIKRERRFREREPVSGTPNQAAESIVIESSEGNPPD